MSAVVALVGRPNVGKSSLFNRIVGERASLVDDRPGVTRDRLYRTVDWEGRRFTLVDTGGLTEAGGEGFFAAMRSQILRAVAEAAVLVLVVDARAGLTPEDRFVAEILRRSRKPVVVAANKVDHARVDWTEAFGLGLGEVSPVSAAHGRGVEELVARVLARLPEAEEEAPEEERPIKVAIVGRPNAGKSTLTNRLLGEERALVTELPGTTTDPVEGRLVVRGRRLRVVDTAGLRRRTRTEDELERRSQARALAAVRTADVAILLVDATIGLADQDRRIAGQAVRRGRPLVIAWNKWDLVPPELRAAPEGPEAVVRSTPWLRHVPTVPISALSGENLDRLLDAVLEAYEASLRRIAEPELTAWLEAMRLLARRRAPAAAGLAAVRQEGVRPPAFVFAVKDPERVGEDLARFLEGELRRAFRIGPTPVRLRFVAERR